MTTKHDHDALVREVAAAIETAWLNTPGIGTDWGRDHPWNIGDWNPVAEAAVRAVDSRDRSIES
jgi:hypothetical protein